MIRFSKNAAHTQCGDGILARKKTIAAAFFHLTAPIFFPKLPKCTINSLLYNPSHASP